MWVARWSARQPATRFQPRHPCPPHIRQHLDLPMSETQRGPVLNAVIESAEISFARDVFLLPSLTFKLANGFHQGWGDWVLCEPKPGGGRRSTWAFGETISRLMAAAEVRRWSEMAGRTVRIVHDKDGLGGRIIGVGHIVNDDHWFYPSDMFEGAAA